MTHGATVVPTSAKQLGPDARLRFQRQANNSTDENADTSSGSTWLGANWYWLLVLLVAVFVFILLAIICCCYKQSTSLGGNGQFQLSSIKTSLPSTNLTGFTSPVSTSVGDRESYHGNLVVSPGVLSTEQTPVASPQLHFTSSSTQLKQQHSPQNTTPSRYSYRRKNPSPGNSSGSEETIRHATGTPSISSFTSVSSSLNGKMSRAQSFTGVGQQPRLSRRRSGSQVKIISLSRGASSLSVTSTASNSSAHSGASNQSSVNSHGACQSDSAQHTYLAVDVQVRVNREMTQQEKNMYTAVVLAESAAKLAQSAANYGEEPIVPVVGKSHKMRASHRRYYSTAAGLRQASNESPTKKTSPSHSVPMPILHTKHYNTPANDNSLHSREGPVVSLDNCVRGGQCTTEKPRPVSLSSNDTGDEMFTPKQSLAGTIDIIGPPPNNRSQLNSSEKDRGRVKKSKVVANNGADEVKKKKRHSHQSVPTAQVPKDHTSFPDNKVSEMPPHTRNPHVPADQPVDSIKIQQPLPEDSSANLPPGRTNKQTPNDNPVANGNGDDKEGEKANNEEETSKKKTIPSLGPSSQLKQKSASISHSSSLSSVADVLNQSQIQGPNNLKRQCSVPNIALSTNSSHTNHIPRLPSGTSLSASGYGASVDSASSVDSISTFIKPRELNNTFSYPLRKLLEGEHDRRGATDLQFSGHHHQYISSSAASSGMAEKPLSPALPFVSTNGFSTPYSNSTHVSMYGGRTSVTGMASAEV